MNNRRHSHSSCVLKENIYVFCGHDYLSGDGYLSSIEVVNANKAIDYCPGFGDDYWRLIEVQDKQLSTRINPSVVPISPYEILVMGGARSGKKYCSDGYIWNANTGEFTQILDPKSSYSFTTYGNMFGEVGRGKVAGLVTDIHH